jgi:hypothetical protein
MKFLPNFTKFICGAPLHSWAQISLSFGADAKVIGYTFDHFPCGNRELHATQVMFLNTVVRTTISN